MRSKQGLLRIVRQGGENGRIAPGRAACIAAGLPNTKARATGYGERIRRDAQAS